MAKSIPQSEKRLIMKFGSSCIEKPGSYDHIAAKLIEEATNYTHIIVVVSAMRDVTDQLISLAHKVHPEPPKREYDMMVSVGERISIALLAMALSKRGEEAISFTGSQSGIITTNTHSDAEIIAVKPSRILDAMKSHRFIIVAGFQGVSQQKEITTLGRGGSDTTAVALAASLQAEKLQFYKDVPGIADKDPSKHHDASYYQELSYKSALEIVQRSERAIIHPRALLLAEKEQIPLEIKSMIPNGHVTYVRKTSLSPSANHL